MLDRSLNKARAMKDFLSPIRSRMPARLSAFLGCTSGGSAVEFAILVPVYIMLLIGMFEVAWVMYIQSSMEGALRQGARYGITGQGGSDTARDAAILARLNEFTFGSVTITSGMVEKKKYASFSDVGLPEPFTDTVGGPNDNNEYDVGETYTDTNNNGQWDEDRGIDGVGNSGEVVRYRIEYTLQPLTGLVEAFTGGLHLSATTVVRNEPYAGG
jgi:hypothetical protein